MKHNLIKNIYININLKDEWNDLKSNSNYISKYNAEIQENKSKIISFDNGDKYDRTEAIYYYKDGLIKINKDLLSTMITNLEKIRDQISEHDKRSNVN